MLPQFLRRLVRRWRLRPRRTPLGRAPSFELAAAGLPHVCVAYNDFGAYCVPLESAARPAARCVMAGAVYERETIALIQSACGTGDVVHAGTFFGDFLPALSQALAPTAKVWAFEPNPQSARCARVTCALNGLSNVALTEAALGERSQALSFVTRDAQGTPLGGASHVGESSDALKVAGRSIDELVGEDRQVSVIHLDVEGHEVQALRGALATIARSRPLLIVETWPGDAWVQAHLSPLGYERAEGVCNNTVLRVRA